MKTTFIYKIINNKNNKFYLGSTCALEGRWKEHRWALLNNRHINTHLQSSWNKYGEKSFEFLLIDTIKGDRDAGYTLEQWYLDNLHDRGLSLNCYNYSRCARVPRTTVEKDIYVYDYKGELVEVGLTAYVAKKYKYKRRTLQEHCRSVFTNHVNGFLFRYKEDSHLYNDQDLFKNKNHVIHLDPLGGFIAEYTTHRSVDKSYGYTIGNISDSIKKKTRMADNTYFKYKYDYEGNYEGTHKTTEELLTYLDKDKIDLSGYFFKIQVFDIQGVKIGNYNSIREVSNTLCTPYEGLNTHIVIKKKNNFKLKGFYLDKYIIHISGIYDLLEDYSNHLLEYYEIKDENGEVIFTSVVGTACKLLGVNYDVFYRRKRDNITQINGKNITYHNSNG